MNSKVLENNPTAKQRYGFLLYISCLANDKDYYNKLEKQYQSTKDSENYNSLYSSVIYANALAECGETEKSWEIMKNIPGQTFASLTKWTLALDPLYQHYFSKIPEYQAMVKRLKQEKQKQESVK